MNADDTNEAQRFHVGSTIAGRYRVEKPIGEGAMGAVALARHVSLDETVAIKFLRPELRRDPVAIARLSREARALARIKSDHVARVLDVGATLSVGPYMVMEYLEGIDLGELLEREGPLPVSRAVEFVLQVCEALTVAHTAGIVHRDIKPHNLFLARHGQFETLKVLDFGICEAATASAGSAPTEAAPYGTPSYMSPERVLGDLRADHRADIWSVGVVLHELVTGRAVFDGGELTEVCARIVSDAPPELEADVAVLPPRLRDIIARCLQRDPDRRYQSIEELAAALAPLATMHERFRGRTTGAFSRRLLEAELANGASLAPVASPGAERGARAPFGGATSAGAAARAGSFFAAATFSALFAQPGAGSRLLARLSGAARARSLAVPLAVGAFVAASLVRGVTWMAPPPPTPVALAAGVSTSSSAPPTAAAVARSEPIGPARAASEASAARSDSSVARARSPEAAQGDAVPVAEPSERSPRTKAERRSIASTRPKARRSKSQSHGARVRARTSRVRLVAERRAQGEDSVPKRAAR